MTSRELQIFLTVVECGKMTETARRLYITQSSVSQAIASIEKEYDITLFERFSTGLYLTPVGKQLADRARSYFEIKKDIDSFLINASDCHVLRVGASITVGTAVISKILRRMKDINPDLQLSVEIANTHILESFLLENKIDIALLEGNITSHELNTINIFEDRLVLICSPEHPFSSRNTIDIEELADEPLILREQGSGTRSLFEEQMRRRNIPMNVQWNCYNSEAIKTAVKDGHGVSVISRLLVETELENGSLHCAEINGVNLNRHFSIVYHRRKYISQLLNQFIEECKSFASEVNSR